MNFFKKITFLKKAEFYNSALSNKYSKEIDTSDLLGYLKKKEVDDEDLKSFIKFIMNQTYAIDIIGFCRLNNDDMLNGFHTLLSLGLGQVYKNDYLPVMIFVRELPFAQFCKLLTIEKYADEETINDQMHDLWMDFARRVFQYQEGKIEVWSSVPSEHKFTQVIKDLMAEGK
jgi:hypothetical protein